jgi:ribosomal protein S18 acetylase RimI-like enzyme
VELSANDAAGRLDQLARLLVDAVDGGAAVGFLRPLPLSVATAFWTDQIERLAAGAARLLAVLDESDRVCGVVMVNFAPQQNGQHRAEITKLIVRSDTRRSGHGSRLLDEAEETARAHGRWLLLLDTVPGSDAERLYRRHGWREVGVVEDFALSPDGEPAPTRIFSKRLA